MSDGWRRWTGWVGGRGGGWVEMWVVSVVGWRGWWWGGRVLEGGGGGGRGGGKGGGGGGEGGGGEGAGDVGHEADGCKHNIRTASGKAYSFHSNHVFNRILAT